MKKPEVYTFDSKPDLRGNLTFLEELKSIPFEIKRVYWLYDLPEQQTRGDHAHKTGEQVIIAIKGKIQVLLESIKGDFFNCTLDKADKALYIPPMWWGKMIFSKNTIMIGLASDEFDENDYIRKRSEFK
ncbi:FdtA/QdtA family cupin domain-containing protein [Roseivirga sp.]|uniref:sugar 3,4-ketoisomerase n=1 Tax=Roseivirga sp. TaxID=1964215 RepID=UPI002B26ABEE|nr:FdtA/QdtA family cupin domain-containing protein [Roseivirga sp.]